MFTQFSTADNLSKASTMVFRIGTDAHLYDDPDDVSIIPLLDSKFDSEKCEALKRLLALIAQGLDVSNFFPQVVKNVATQSLEVKKLVYLYLLHYAEKRPNEALLSINCFQRDLGDPNPLVRAWALRTMAGIRLHVIAPLVLVALGKCARDPSVYVRKCAANALPKLNDLRVDENATAIEEIIGILLNDNSPGVVGAAAAAFASVCPNNLALIGKTYRRLCETLPDVEEWGQIVLIGILLRYVVARHGLVKESIMASSCSKNSASEKNCSDSDTDFLKMGNTNDMRGGLSESDLAAVVSRSYLEGPDKFVSQSTTLDNSSYGFNLSHFTSAKNDDDVKVLLQCTSPLLWSQNSAVVLAAAGVHWIMAPRDDIRRIVKPLLFLLRSSNASKYVLTGLKDEISFSLLQSKGYAMSEISERPRLHILLGGLLNSWEHSDFKTHHRPCLQVAIASKAIELDVFDTDMVIEAAIIQQFKLYVRALLQSRGRWYCPRCRVVMLNRHRISKYLEGREGDAHPNSIAKFFRDVMWSPIGDDLWHRYYSYLIKQILLVYTLIYSLIQVLCNIQVFAKAMPSLFAPNFEDFFITSSDTYQIKSLKLEILASIATEMSITAVFQEFQDYVRDPDRRFAADTVAAISLCAQRLPKIANTCLEGLLALATPKSMNGDIGSLDGEALVLTQAIVSIKAIIKLDPPSHDKVIVCLARNLDTIKVPAARAMIIWTVGEYNSVGQIIPKLVPTILKYLAHCFTSEALETKLQILNAAVKVLLCANGEDIGTSKSILSYVLELAKVDLNYDVRDRARVFKKLLSCYIGSDRPVEETDCNPENNGLQHLLAEYIFGEKTKSTSTEAINYRFYLPGSLSHIVLHAAPLYEPLPEPCSLDISNGVEGITTSGQGATHTDNDTDTDSGSLDEEGTGSYGYGSQDSITSSRGLDNTDESGSGSAVDDNTGSLINFSDLGKSQNQNRGSEEHDAHNSSHDFGELMSKRALESWLDENPGSTQNVSEPSNARRSLARISIGDIGRRVKPKTYMLLDPANSNGLRVDYVFTSEISSISPLLVSVEASFRNCSTEPMSKLFLSDENSECSDSLDEQSTMNESSLTSHIDVPTLVPMEEITHLEPGETTKRVIQVHFHHHLLPLKLVLWCNGKRHPVKLRPDIGYFVKPLPMDSEAFLKKESQLPGMFEYIRRCSFSDHIGDLKDDKGDMSLTKDKFLVICESLASKMLSNANLFLVSVEMPVSTNLDDASGLCLRFCGEILSQSSPCLITVTLQGKCSEPLDASVKVNCEETVFGLNLLNRIVNFLAEPPVAC